jgi:hypothetical protein
MPRNAPPGAPPALLNDRHAPLRSGIRRARPRGHPAGKRCGQSRHQVILVARGIRPVIASPAPQSAHPRLIDSDELARERWKRRDGVVNASGLRRGICVFATYDDPRMGYAGPVEPDEVTAIQGEHCPTGVRREVEDFVIGYRLPRVARFACRENVVAERS